MKVLSPNAIVTIFGTNFAPAGTATQAGLVNGQLPTNVAGVCVEFGTVRAPIFAVYPSQINVQVPAVTPGNIPVQVITDCDTPQAVASPPVSVAAQATAPEFFYFTTNASGANPIAAINAVTGGYIGAPGLISGATFTPAKSGDYLTLFRDRLRRHESVVRAGRASQRHGGSDRAGLHHIRRRDAGPGGHLVRGRFAIRRSLPGEPSSAGRRRPMGISRW